MTVQGTLIAVLPVEERPYGDNKVFKSQQVVIEYEAHDTYPKRLLLTFKEKAFEYIAKSNVGDTVKAEYDGVAKEYIDKKTSKTKFFGELSGWKYEVVSAGSGQPASSEAMSANTTSGNNSTAEEPDSLPF
jgi:hypothetical protein